MTTLEILKAARELLAVPERWTKGVGARDVKGNPQSAYEPSATCFCTAGALAHSTGKEAYVFCKQACAALGFTWWAELHVWNDAPERTHAEVLARFDEAIAKLEEKVC